MLMKNKLICLVAVLAALAGILAACGEKGPTSVSAYKSEGDFPQIKEQLTWEKLNAFPQKREDMTPDEARQLCVDFFRFSKTALWTPDEDMDYIRNAAGNPDSMAKGTIYGGLPYIGLGSGNVYRLMDYMDETTGVVDLSNAADVLKSLGKDPETEEPSDLLNALHEISGVEIPEPLAKTLTLPIRFTKTVDPADMASVVFD